MLALVHQSRNRTSLTKAATVNKSTSLFPAIVVVSPTYSSGIIEMIFRFGRQYQQPHVHSGLLLRGGQHYVPCRLLLTKRGTLTRRSHLYLTKRTNHQNLKEELRTKDKRNFSRLWKLGLLFWMSNTIIPSVITYPLWMKIKKTWKIFSNSWKSIKL